MLDDTVSALAMLLATVFKRVFCALMPLPAILKTLAGTWLLSTQG
jgi:hypothetical protein